MTSIAPVSAAGLPETNGNKLAAGLGGLNVVFTDNNDVKYSRTSDGVTWSPPLTIAANANHPTIAVAGTTIGVAYVTSGGLIRYVYKKQPSLTWNSIGVTTSGTSSEPTMVGYNSRMHLAWVAPDGRGGTNVQYTNFPAAPGGVPPSELASQLPPCIDLTGITLNAYRPAIAVTKTSATDAQPLVRMAYFDSAQVGPTAPPCNGNSLSSGFSYFVMQRSGANWYIAFPLLSTIAGSPGDVSMSIAANPDNGDFYMAESMVENGAETTYLWYQNSWNPSGLWRQVQVLPRKAHIDVEAACGRFRIAVSDFTQGSGNFGPTWYRTGTWTGTGLAPTWDEPVGVPLSGFGANPQALFASAQSGTVIRGVTHLVSAVFDDRLGTTYSIKHDDRSYSGPSIVTPCTYTRGNTKGFLRV
jgi:hypothetical protein